MRRREKPAIARFRWTDESTVEIHARSSVHPIHAETHEVTGEAVGELRDGSILLDPQPNGYVELPVDALRSGNMLEDMEMRRRVDARRYPTIRYDLAEATGGPERFKLRGSLTFHGVTREFVEEVRARVDGDTLFVEGEHTFDVRDFGVAPPKILILQVHPDVRVVARLVGARA